MRLISLVLLGGCTSMLGLTQTAIAIDRDGDGVYDEFDNCPDVPNADQDPAACASCRTGQDLDRDGIDDGCDACPLGINGEDEDGDGLADACDPCPTVAGGAGEPDTDGDGIGDACDRTPDPAPRRFFDGFDRDLPDWSSSSPWPVANGARTASTTDTLELYAVRVVDTDTRWTVTVGLVLPPTGDDVGVELFDDSRRFPIVCGFVRDGTGWHLEVTDVAGAVGGPSTLAFAAGTHVDLVVYATHAGNIGAPVVHCEANGDAVTVTPVYEARRGIALHSQAATSYEYVDLVAP